MKAIEPTGDRGCLTVAQLKELVRDWPEVNQDGEPTEVWIETGWCLSSPAVHACPLSRRRMPDGTDTADLILESALYREPPRVPRPAGSVGA